ncbi:MAG TPA: TetR/AcrR family transcriptional regulator [Firmicutes bacterium]|nr:TetR/AcrR family transcriptional regulator [Bacillota bacterium]
MSEVNLPKTSRGWETLEKILSAAEKYFGEKGYYNTSITDICALAGIAPGTFYIYFSDKIGVFRYLVRILSKDLRKEIALNIKNCKSRFEAEHVGFKTFFDFIAEHPNLYKIIWQAQMVDEELFKEYYVTIGEGYVRGLAEAQQKGEVAEIDPEVLAYCFMGITNFVGLRWVIWEKAKIPEHVLHDVLKFIKEGAFEKA